jgi:hypothetical protein
MKWDEDWAYNPEAFHAALVAARRGAYEAYKNGDSAPLRGVLDSLQRMDGNSRTEPWASIYETHLAGTLLIQAEYWIDRLEWQPGFNALQNAWDLLSEKAHRRALMGLEKRPESENRFRLLTLLASAKWLGPELNRLVVLNPLEMWEHYEAVVDTVRGAISAGLRGPLSTANLLYGLSWCGVQLLCMGQRFLPGCRVRWLSEYEAYFPGKLRDKSLPFYWQFRIGEEVAGGRCGAVVLQALYNSRNTTIERAVPGMPMHATLTASRREVALLAQRSDRGLEVIGA